MFADAWKAVPDKGKYNLIPVKTPRNVLLERTVMICENMRLINIPVFFILGTMGTRGDCRPDCSSNILAAEYFSNYVAQNENFLFAVQTAQRQKVGEIDNYIPLINVDNDMDYLRQVVKKVLLQICSKMSLLIS
jgi:hypothetical protein